MNEDGRVVIKIDLDNKSFDAEITRTEKDLDKMLGEYDRLQEISRKGIKVNSEQMEQLALKIQKTSNRLIDLKEKRDALNEVDDEPEKKINLLENLTKGVKRLAFGILGIRTAYTIIRKASSAYLSTDEHTTKQLEANWTAIGTFMETMITTVSSLMKKLVTSVLYFASVLTGINYIEKANTAILKKQAKATQGLTNANDKLKASFDEIETLGNDSSGGIGSDIDTSVLFDIADIGEGTRSTIEKIGTALQPVYNILKEIIEYCSKNPNSILLALGGLALVKTLSSIIGIAGKGAMAGSGLSGVASLLSYIAGFGVIAIEISILYSTVKDARDAVKLAHDETEKWKNGIIQLNDTAKLILDENKDTPEFIDNLSDRIENQVQELINSTKQIEENRKEMSLFDMIIGAITGTWQDDTDTIIANYEAMKSSIETWEKAYKQGKLNDDQIKEYNETLKIYKKYLEDATYETSTHSSELRAEKGAYEDAKNELKKTKERLKEFNDVNKTATENTKNNATSTKNYSDNVKDLDKKLKDMTGQVNDYNNALGKVKKDVTTKFNVDTSGAKNSINSLFDKLKTGLLRTFGLTFPTIRLAKGGIINQPGRGVPLGSAIGGERRPEGVIPLTDAQQMEMMGEAIGKYVTINATIPVYAYNRQVDRQIRRISAENDFASNR